MNTSKIKNFIIVLLAVVNLFFLSIVLSDGDRERAARRQVLTDVVEILGDSRIAVSDGADLSRRQLPLCTVRRDMDRELELVDGVLGGATAESEGGGIIYYRGKLGQATFRGTGDFEFVMVTGACPIGRDPEATARAFAEELGLKVMTVSGLFEDEGTGTVELLCRAEGAKVLNCRLTCGFYSGSLMLINGVRPLDLVYSDKNGGELLDVPTVLMRFLETVNSGGYVCSELLDIELCYVQRSSASGSGTLSPVWRLETDSGDICLDGLDGESVALT